MFLITVAEFRKECHFCMSTAAKGTKELVTDSIRQLVPECLVPQDSLQGIMGREINLRLIDILLGRNAGTELAFSVPKRLLGEEEFLELGKAGWNTGHWYTNPKTGELMVEVSTFEHSIR